MMARHTSVREFGDAPDWPPARLLAAACMPAAAAEFSPRQDVAAPATDRQCELCEPARWLGKAAPVAPVTKIADQQDSGWWVVLATVPADTDVRATVREFETCGLRPFNDFSSKFDGFKPGFQVVVDGAYATRSEAESVRSAASGCAPDAYVKRARYLGE